MTREADGFTATIAVVAVFVVVVLAAPLDAMALAYVWNRLVVGWWPVEAIGWKQGLGPSVFLGLSTIQVAFTGSRGPWACVGYAAVVALVAPVLILAMGAGVGVWL